MLISSNKMNEKVWFDFAVSGVPLEESGFIL